MIHAVASVFDFSEECFKKRTAFVNQDDFQHVKANARLHSLSASMIDYISVPINSKINPHCLQLYTKGFLCYSSTPGTSTQ